MIARFREDGKRGFVFLLFGVILLVWGMEELLLFVGVCGGFAIVMLL